MAKVSLPRLPRKRVVYIDQNGLSCMMKALNPATHAHQRGQIEPFWLDAFSKLHRLVKLQLLVCPSSETHEKESFVSPFEDALETVYDLLSGGVEFNDFESIRVTQMLHFLDKWAGRPGWAEPTFDVRRVVHGPLEDWQPRLRIKAAAGYPATTEEVRAERGQMETGIVAAFRRWQAQKPAFEAVFREEGLSYGRAIVGLVQQFVLILARAQAGLPVDPGVCMPPLAVYTMHVLRMRLEHLGRSESAAFKGARDFLLSEVLLEVPYNRIRSLLFAKVSQKAGAGQKSTPKGSLGEDFQMISTVMPYCDAMFVDRYCAGLLKELQPKLPYPCRIFSVENKEEFMAYLDSVEAAAAPDHLARVAALYGAGWDRPYLEVFQDTSSVHQR